jgi:lambda family phage portal protein
MSSPQSKPVVRVRAGDAVGASARVVAEAGAPRTSYAAGDSGHPMLANWNPPLRSADADWLRDRRLSIARIRDIERNEGWVSAAVDRQVDMLVGGALRLNSRPDADALGIELDEAHELGRQIQAKFRIWADDPTFRCDAERDLPFSGLAGLVAREFVGIGESLSIVRWIERPGWPYRTALQVIDPDRLSNPNGVPDGDRLRGGIEKDGNNAPIAYHIRRGHPGDVALSTATSSFRWDRIARWDRIGDWERPKVLHVKDKRRPGQSRGIAKLVAGLTKVRGLSRYSESEIRTAAINATIVGSLYTQLGAEYAADRLGTDAAAGSTDWSSFNTQRADFYKDRNVLDEARFLTLFPSDRLDLNTQPRQTAGYPQFQTAFLQALAAALGISYEQLSMDWSRTNYSSARAALNEVWRGVTRLRAILIWSFALPLFAAWLEDALDAGEIDVPAGAVDFYDAPAAWLRSEWIGPGRGYVDPVKEAQAAGMRMDQLVSTLEREAAEQGLDWEQLLDQRAREDEEIARRGLSRGRTDLSVTPRSDAEDRRPVDQ